METIRSNSNSSQIRRKRLGRMCRGMKLGIIIPVEGGGSACKGKSEDRRS